MTAATGSTGPLAGSLLTDISLGALDPAYAEAAAGRPAGGAAPHRSRSSPLLALGVLVLGLLLSTAAAQVRARSSVTDTARADLVEQVTARVAANDRLQGEVAGLRASTARTRDGTLALTGAGAAQRDRVARLEAASGGSAVEGPGIVVRVDDAPTADASTAGPRDRDEDDEGRVRDTDLQKVVNGLWAAGAEAVSVNGQRLTALSAIRSAGEAILVSYRQLAPPYLISAIGDQRRLATAFRAGSGGRYLDLLSHGYGIRSSVAQRATLRLPAAAASTLRHAQPLRTTAGAGP